MVRKDGINMLTKTERIIKIIILNMVLLLVFFVMLKYLIPYVPELKYLYIIPLFIDIVFMVYQGYKILIEHS